MDIDDARHLAHELMRRHGVADWNFGFDRAKRRLGCCHYASRTITLSSPLTRLNAVDVVRDTLLHEIAHALTPGAGHGPRWKRAARELGAVPRSCASVADVTLPPAPYALLCDGCGARLARYRRPRRRYVCRACYDRHQRGAGPRPAPLRVVASTG